VSTAKARKSTAGRPFGRPRTEERSPRETRERLVEAASAVFAELGYEGASIQAIAAAADITSGTIYRHFESKAALLLEVVQRAVHAVPLVEHLRAGHRPEPADLARLVSFYAEPSLQRTRRLAIEIHAAASRDAKARAQLVAGNELMHQAVARRIEECKDAGLVVSNLDADRAASLLLVMIMGLAHMETLQPSLVRDADWKSFVEHAIGAMLEGHELGAAE